MAQACPGRPAAAELEAAIAALPSKKDALREAFDRLAACSPVPLPFIWADLDAHISSLHSSFSLRFSQLQVLEAARPTLATSLPGETLVDGKARNQDEGEEEEVEEVEEVSQEEVREEEAHEAMSKEDNNGDKPVEVDDEADGEMQEAGDEMSKYNKEGEEDEPEEEVTNEADDEMGNKDEEEDEIMEANDKMGKKAKGEKEIDADEEMCVADEEEQDAKDAKKSFKEAKEEEADEEDQDVNKEDVVAKKVSVTQNKDEAVCEDEEEEEAQEADEEEQDAKDAKKLFKEPKEEEADAADQDVNKEDVVAKKVYVTQNKDKPVCEDEEEEEAQEADEEEHGVEDSKKVYRMQDKEEGEQSGSRKVSQELGNRASPGGSKAVCATMNTRCLVKSVCNCIILGQELPIGIRCHPDAPAITLSSVKLFLHNNKPKTNKTWGKCVTLFRSVPAVAAKPSTDTMEQAKRVAKDWKEMIENPGSSMVIGNLASWGLLYFLISYNIVSEFDTNEIIRLFGTVPRNKQKKNTVELLNGLGLANRITDLIDYLIGNGQQLDAVHLAHVFNLVDKYPPLSLLKGYLEKAKQTVIKIFGKNITSKSQDVVVEKEVNNLRDAHNVVKQHISDASQCSIIVAEIVNLLYEYGKKKRSSANGSASTSNSQQQQKQSNGKRKKEELEQERHVGQEEQLTKPGDKLGQKQNKPQQKQQQGTDKQENNPQDTQQRRSKRPRQRAPKRPKPAVPAVPNMARIGHFGHTRYGAMLGVHSHPAHPCWPGVEGFPFAPQLGAPQYIVPFDDPFYPHPPFYPW